MTPKIVLHIGAHKTATTHLQQSIEGARGALLAQGIRYFGPKQLRGDQPTVLQRFDLPGAKGSLGDYYEAYGEMIEDGHRLAISEENVSGSVLNRFAKVPEPIYPKTEERLSDLAKKIAPQGLDICLGIRQPTSYLNSAFSQHLMSGGAVPLKKFVWKNPPRIVDWAEYVARIAALDGVRSITVWRYEDYAKVFPQIIAAFLGQRALPLVIPLDRIIHQGVSQEAAAQMESLRQDGVKENIWGKVKAAFPVSEQNPTLNAFGTIEHTTSRVGYGLQLRKIATTDKVTLLQP